MKIQLSLLLLCFVCSIVKATATSPADTVQVVANKTPFFDHPWEKIGKIMWPANWFKKAKSDSSQQLNPIEPRFENQLQVSLKHAKVKQLLRVRWDKTQKPRQLAIFSLEGEKMLDFKLAYAGLGDLELPVAQLIPGKYLLRILGEAGEATLMFEKQ
jgi:hypothetical protein